MSTLIIVFFGIVAFSVAAYAWYVTKHITIANDTLDKQAIVANADGWWAWLNAKLIGWKTIILVWFGGVTQAFVFASQQDWSGLQSLPWVQVFDEKIASYITIACFMLSAVTHVFGMKSAAVATPTE